MLKTSVIWFDPAEHQILAGLTPERTNKLLILLLSSSDSLTKNAARQIGGLRSSTRARLF